MSEVKHLKEGRVYSTKIVSLHDNHVHTGEALYLGKIFGAYGKTHGMLFRNGADFPDLIKFSNVEKRNGTLFIKGPTGVYEHYEGEDKEGLELMLQEAGL